jgi:hypothetical protein
MDQTTNTVVHATEEFLRDSLAKATLRIGELEQHIATVTQRSYGEAAERSRIASEMQEWTLEAMEHGTIDEETAQSIADICGFELTKEFELEVTVQYSITANAKSEEEAINLMYDIDFDSVSHPEEITYLSSSVDRVDV